MSVTLQNVTAVKTSTTYSISGRTWPQKDSQIYGQTDRQDRGLTFSEQPILESEKFAVSAEQTRGPRCSGCSYHVTVFALNGCHGICPPHNAAIQDVNMYIIITYITCDFIAGGFPLNAFLVHRRWSRMCLYFHSARGNFNVSRDEMSLNWVICWLYVLLYLVCGS
jgi:hypothetical protein